MFHAFQSWKPRLHFFLERVDFVALSYGEKQMYVVRVVAVKFLVCRDRRCSNWHEDGTTNTLTDTRVLSQSGTMYDDKKGSIYAKGVLIFTGENSAETTNTTTNEADGTLTVTNSGYKHAIYAKDYVRIGYNGAGKTTLIKLLMRLYDPTSGTISYHGKDVSTLCPREYHKRIGVVFQDYQMFGANLGENVVMDNMTEQELKDRTAEVTRALEASGFGERLMKLPDGLFTQVTTEFDKKGMDFSGGESQKIAISRAFYKNADILIMDEPSSALDPIAEYELNKAMETAAKGKTVFYISHRLSTTRGR